MLNYLRSKSFSKQDKKQPKPQDYLEKVGDKMLVKKEWTKSNERDIMLSSLSSDKGKIVADYSKLSSLGTYETTDISEREDYDIAARMIVDTNHHISNWKNDQFIGHGKKNAVKIVKICPTWDSKKAYMMVSRLVVWICPTIPDPTGRLLVALIDPNKSAETQVVLKGSGTIEDPVCFVFYLNWSIPKENNKPETCCQLHILCDQEYKEGVSFASVMYCWTKEFCDSPRADLNKSCTVIPINRAIRARSQAFIEACKLIIPKGNGGKQIKSQIEDLCKNLELAAKEEEDSEEKCCPELTFDEGI